MHNPRLFIIFLAPLLFFLAGLITLHDYGINWDNSMHYNRGQAYLHYFLTGKTNFLDLPKSSLDEAIDFKDIRGNYMSLFTDAKRSNFTDQNIRRSYYQSDVFNFEYFKDKDSGHPPLNGILAALTNYIFYQKLGILGDLHSYLLFNIIASSLIVLGAALFVFYLYGTFPAIIAAGALSLYPLFLGESHFNVKDPVEASFFGLTIICFYFGVVKNNFRLLIGSAIFAGFSLGTKFNVLFLPFILVPWLIFYWATIRKFKVSGKEIYILFVIAIIPLIIFYISWPYLWFNGFSGLLNILNYYAGEGTGSTAALNRFTFFGFNLFPASWIIITTPIPVLVLSIIGIFQLVRNLVNKKDHISLLILLWLLVPIIRVTLPNTAIYGGVRHIMEFVPALAITAAVGSYYLVKKFHKLQNSVMILIIFSMLLVVMEMIKFHPNENIYFNQIIGGLSGAKEKNIPYWGNSFGNAYQQGVVWLNKNSETGAKLGLPIGGTVNLPKENLRPDINLSNDNFSGFAKEGEYEMEMSHDGMPKDIFSYAYPENFLNPVYEVKVDGVSILKIWKNDLEHVKEEIENEIKYPVKNVIKYKTQLKIELTQEIYLTRLYINYDKSNCRDKRDGSISVSTDGVNWKTKPDPISYNQMSLNYINAALYDFVFLFAAERAKFINLNLTEEDYCLFNNPRLEIMGLKMPPR